MVLLLSMSFAQVLDATREVPMASGVHLAMGRTGIAWAHGPTGLFQNPAAPAIRTLESRSLWSVQGTASMSTVVEASGVDLGTLGIEDQWSGLDALAGASVGYRNGAGGVVVSRSGRRAGGARITVRETHATGSWARRDGCCAFGVGYRGLAVGSEGEQAYAYSGSALQFGGTFYQEGLTLGAVLRLPVRAEPVGDPVEGLPATAVKPLEVGLGLAWRGVGPWTGLPTRFAFDLVARAPTEGLSQEAATFGLVDVGLTGAGPVAWGLGPRVGLELEPRPDVLRVRGGAWVQMPDLALASPTMHLTGGVQVKLLTLRVRGWEKPLSVSTAFDVSDGYREISWLSVGFWDSGAVGVPWTSL